MERCIYCGSTRKSAPSLRFFGVPKEPGLKRIQWLYVLGNRTIGPKDRVCAIHFRQGKPSNDPSHEDFVPHLHLNEDVSESSIELLESLGTIGEIQSTKGEKRMKPTILRKKSEMKLEAKQNYDIANVNAHSISRSARPTLRISIPPSLCENMKLEQGQKVIIRNYRIVKKINSPHLHPQ